jgi:hypothetical protein
MRLESVASYRPENAEWSRTPVDLAERELDHVSAKIRCDVGRLSLTRSPPSASTSINRSHPR